MDRFLVTHVHLSHARGVFPSHLSIIGNKVKFVKLHLNLWLNLKFETSFVHWLVTLKKYTYIILSHEIKKYVL